MKEKPKVGQQNTLDKSFLKNGVTAHRGNSLEYPENTMEAFMSAINIGVDWIELDIHKTRDGKLVVIHDGDTGRVGDIDARISDVLFRELLDIDVAYGFRKSNNLTLKECPKARIPLLSDIINLAKSQKKTRVSIQPKVYVVPDAVALVKKMEAGPWIGFNDMDLEKMKTVKKLESSFPVFFDRWRSDIRDDIRNALTWSFETVVLHYSELTKDKVKALHVAGIEAGAWVVDDPEVMRRCIRNGVDRIYTNAPAALLRIQ
jgi:glycerophosphoryl diester phosphodiesterase